MTVARAIYAGTTYLVTRRCTQRQFWLKPSGLTNQIVRYCVAYAAEKTGVAVHAVCAMGNHIHLVCTDVEGRMPEFLQWANLHIAKCINASYGRWENLWSSEQTSLVQLVGPEDVLDKTVYTLMNPVTAGLVRYGDEWPGVRTGVEQLGGAEEVVLRPKVFFQEEGGMPETATLRIEPPATGGLAPGEWAREVGRLVKEGEGTMRSAMQKAGRSFLGAKRVLAQLPTDSPETVAARRGLSPRVGAKNKWRRIEALSRLKAFVSEYRAAYEKWKQGMRDVVFPAGTWAMRVYQGAATAAAP